MNGRYCHFFKKLAMILSVCYDKYYIIDDDIAERAFELLKDV